MLCPHSSWGKRGAKDLWCDLAAWYRDGQNLCVSLKADLRASWKMQRLGKLGWGMKHLASRWPPIVRMEKPFLLSPLKTNQTLVCSLRENHLEIPWDGFRQEMGALDTQRWGPDLGCQHSIWLGKWEGSPGRCFVASWVCRQKYLTGMAVYTCHRGQKQA